MSKKIAFVTCDMFPDLTPHDRLAAEELERRGHVVQAVLWDDKDLDWSSFDAVVPRSTWDYFKRLDEFSAWLDRLEHVDTTVWNPLNILHWNKDKRYLRDLEKQRVEIAPTRWLSQGEEAELGEIMDAEGWQRIVVKPVVSAGAEDTFLIDRAAADQYQDGFEAQLSKRAMLVQAYMPEVNGIGEWSFLFFNRKFSHAVLKRPAEDDFRVQVHLGGAEHAATAPERLLAQAAAILEKVDGPLLYARVDAVERDDHLILMELELLEPSLFFKYDEGAAGRFADALLERLQVAG